jgi:hypothetical protein
MENCSAKSQLIELIGIGTRLDAPASGFWSLMSGLVLVTTLQACGFLLA